VSGQTVYAFEHGDGTKLRTLRIEVRPSGTMAITVGGGTAVMLDPEAQAQLAQWVQLNKTVPKPPAAKAKS
jgi:hypothetical protein